MVIDLADLHIRIYSDRLHTENLQRPVPGEADISKARGHMDKESQPARGRTALQHGDVPIRLRKLVGPSQIQPVWFQKKPFLRNHDLLSRIGLFHIQLILLVNQKFIRQRQVIAVRINSLFIKWSNDDLFPHVL